jgi:hypothetical protein
MADFKISLVTFQTRGAELQICVALFLLLGLGRHCTVKNKHPRHSVHCTFSHFLARRKLTFSAFVLPLFLEQKSGYFLLTPMDGCSNIFKC